MMDQFIDFVIRPPRVTYNPDHYLWESEFTLAGRKYKRHDLELTNGRGHSLQCSHYVPADFPKNTALPCVIYCHGNSGCRADANESAVILLPSNITVFTLDFSGSGLSDGDYVSLGWHEKDDLRVVVSFLRSTKLVSHIGLWGRSMGAVTSLLYGAEDPSIACMVLDSAFSNLPKLMMELVDVYKIRLPIFTVKMAVRYMRHVIQKKAKFDIKNLNAVQLAPKTKIPALFGHASGDTFIQPHHSDLIYQAYAGNKKIIRFEGGHNSPRPQSYYDSVSMFFYKALHPPQISPSPMSKLDKYYEIGDLKIGPGTDKRLLYEILTGLHALGTDATSSPSFSSRIPNGSTRKSVDESLSESMVYMSMNKDTDFPLYRDILTNKIGGNSAEESHFQDKSNHNEELYSYSGSIPESWGTCSSIGGSERSFSAEGTGSSHNRLERPIQQKSGKAKERKCCGALVLRKTGKRDSLRERLLMWILGRANCKGEGFTKGEVADVDIGTS